MIKSQVVKMNKVEIILSEERKIEEIKADILVLKNLKEGYFGPEKAVNNLTNFALETFQNDEFTTLGATALIPINSNSKVNSRNVLLIGAGSLASLNYDSIEKVFQSGFSRILQDSSFANISILTVAHGVGFGLEKKEVFMRIISAFLKAFKLVDENLNVKSLIFNENGLIGVPSLFKSIKEIHLYSPDLFDLIDSRIYLNVSPRMNSDISMLISKINNHLDSNNTLLFEILRLQRNHQIELLEVSELINEKLISIDLSDRIIKEIRKGMLEITTQLPSSSEKVKEWNQVAEKLEVTTEVKEKLKLVIPFLFFLRYETELSINNLNVIKRIINFFKSGNNIRGLEI